MLGYSFDETDESPVDESEPPEARAAADSRAAPPRDATRLRGRLRLPKDTALVRVRVRGRVRVRVRVGVRVRVRVSSHLAKVDAA